MRDDVVDALLWEADPDRFATRYPDSGVVESYALGWPWCLDFWPYINPLWQCAVLKSEASSNAAIVVELTGDDFADRIGLPSHSLGSGRPIRSGTDDHSPGVHA